MGMIQTGNRASFALESLARLGMIYKMSWQNLDGDNSIETGIAGFVNLAHSARTNTRKDFVGP